MTTAAPIEGLLDRIRARDPGLRAFIEVDEGGAREAAAESARRIASGSPRALEGMAVAVKANIDVRGLETSAGLAARRGMVAQADAEAVARLRAAGAAILGTLNMHEAALGADTDNPWFGRAFNPHGQGRTPGGSSGGSGAAVAAGLCAVALGTDTLGSVRIPAAYCGVYGLKPTRGAVSQQGLELVVAEFDTIGPLARTLDELETSFRVLADAQPARPIRHVALLAGLGGVRCEASVLAGYERALAALEAEGLAPQDKLDLEAKPVRLAGFVRASHELAERLAPLLVEKPEGVSDNLKFLLDYGRQRSEAEVAEGEALLARTREAVVAAVGGGALLLPTAPQAAFAQGGRAPANQADFTALASVAGLPALTIPAGTDAEGMPVGVQLVGAPGNELGLIELARRLEPHLGGFIAPPVFEGED
ncbi:amidase [Altererythrobacter marinus]|uniref:Amidase n=1 Tax=Pelagerythrobacter marinus TaxID=538382 RepID=A0ABW9UXB6_9SPHN|nr:amidase [Pelagerythrobacter marinus]MXO69476.1 amidase [Pelagerythrobacter marinus]